MTERALKDIDTIIVHCSDTGPEWMEGQPVAAKVAEITRWHKARGWRTIGYHYVIDRDGSVGRGRPLKEVGAHVAGHNRTSVGVCLIGGRGAQRNDDFYQHFTPAQDRALRGLIADLKRQLGDLAVFGHHDFNPHKECPGFRVARWLAGRHVRKSIVQSTTLQAAGVSAASVGGITAQVLGALDGRAQIVALALAGLALAALAWIARERIRKWAEGDR